MRILLIFIILFPLSAAAYDALVPPPRPFAVDLAPYALKTQNEPLVPGHKIGAFEFVDAVELQNDSYRFGGFSSLVILGDHFYSLSDGGRLLRATLKLEDHKITALENPSFTPIWPKNSPEPEKEEVDSEAMIHLKGDTFALGFEQHHRIALYHFGDTIAEEKTFPAPSVLNVLTKPNRGIESLTQLSPDHLFAITEAVKDAQGNTMAYLVDLKKGSWQQLAVKQYGDFRPTDVTILNKEYLLMLERDYNVLDGVSARISLLPRKEIKPGAIITPQEIATFDNQSNIDNMEGIQALPNKDGSSEVFLISDDNHNPLQHTILVWLHLPKHPRPTP